MQGLKPASNGVPWTHEAAALLRLAQRAGHSAGVEYSLKIAPGSIDARRFLISIAVRPDFRAALETGLAALHFPAALEDALTEGLARMRFLHLGYAEPQGVPVCKVYCEAAPQPGARVRIHESFKWRPRENGIFVRDEYWLLRDPGAAAMQARLDAIVRVDAVRTGAGALLGRALARAEALDLFFLEVLRDGVPRACDIRLYDAGLTLADAADAARLAALALAAGQVDGLIREAGQDALGHVSVGADFLTLYHGARPLL